MLHIAICEDNPEHGKHLRALIRACSIQINEDINTQMYLSSTELIEAGNHYDILFMDILLGDENGVEAAMQLRMANKDFILIYTTNSLEYSVEGYKADALRYLVKPLTLDSVKEAIKASIDRLRQTPKTIIVNGRDGGLHFVVLDKLVLVESISRIRVLHYSYQIETWRTLKWFDSILPTNQFAHIQRSFIVNVQHVKKYMNATVYLSNGNNLGVSSIYKSNLISCLHNNTLIGGLQ